MATAGKTVGVGLTLAVLLVASLALAGCGSDTSHREEDAQKWAGRSLPALAEASVAGSRVEAADHLAEATMPWEAYTRTYRLRLAFRTPDAHWVTERELDNADIGDLEDGLWAGPEPAEDLWPLPDDEATVRAFGEWLASEPGYAAATRASSGPTASGGRGPGSVLLDVRTLDGALESLGSGTPVASFRGVPSGRLYNVFPMWATGMEGSVVALEDGRFRTLVRSTDETDALDAVEAAGR